MSGHFAVSRLGPTDLDQMEAMLDLFGTAFEEVETYGAHRPSRGYLSELLAADTFVVLVATTGDCVVGGLAAYELRKFEQPRSEFYIYDLAVDAGYRRCGIATALINALKPIAFARGGSAIFVQADPVNTPAVELYTKLGVREDVFHFDIAPH
jgi:aminoglycoside 3-N-acetyltransferase I